VDLFFVLSGFLIGGILLDAKSSENYFSVFYRRRFFRIVPAYMAVLGLSLLHILLLRVDWTPRFEFLLEGKALPQSLVPYLLFVQNFWMAASKSAHAIDGTWSLAVEEQFYLTLPLLVRFLSLRQLARTAVFVIIGAPVLRVILMLVWPEYAWARFVLMPCRADALMCGVLGAIVLRDGNWRAWIESRRRLFRVLLFVLGAGLALLTLRSPGVLDRGMQIGGLTWLAMFYACVLIYTLSFRSGWLGCVFRVRWLGWLGGIAYGVYLFHMFALGAIFGAFRGREASIEGFSDFLIVLLALVLTLVVCRLSWTYFEKPLVKLGHRTSYFFSVAPEPNLFSPKVEQMRT